MNMIRGTAAGAVLAVGIGLLTGTNAEATRPPGLTISPNSVRPGQMISVNAYCPVGAGGSVTSDGFAEPISFSGNGNVQDSHLRARAVSKPGNYTAGLHCSQWSNAVTAGFTVLPFTPTPTKSKKPSPKPTTTTTKPKKPVVIPKGAVETGSGPRDG